MKSIEKKGLTRATAIAMAIVMVFSMWAVPAFYGTDVVDADSKFI